MNFKQRADDIPADLRELEEFAKSPVDAGKYDYDSATGRVTAKR